jgi:hypothetical protein
MSREFFRPVCGDWRVLPGPSAALVRDICRMQRFSKL